MPDTKGHKLTEKQRRFVEAYMGEAAGNSTKAARLAGYKGSENTLKSIASENLTKPDIIAAIDERVNSDPKIATRKERQAFWTKVMKGEEPGAEMKDRLKASELLGKSHADFVDRHEHKHEGETTQVVRYEYPSNGRSWTEIPRKPGEA